MIEEAERKGGSGPAARSSSRRRQHRRRAGDRGGGQGLPLHLRHAGQDGQEKIALLRAYGAEVVDCPTAVAPESPESYYSVADRLAREIPGAFQPNQYTNPANPRRALRDDRARDLGADRRARSRASSPASARAGPSPASAGTSRSRTRTCTSSAPTRRARSTPAPGAPYKVEGIGEDFWPATFDPRWSTHGHGHRPRLVPDRAARDARRRASCWAAPAARRSHAAIEVAQALRRRRTGRRAAAG